MFRYQVSDENYLEMARWLLLRKRGQKSIAVPKLLLKTVIQMGAAAALLLMYPDAAPWMRWLVATVSVILAVLAVFQYFFVDVRAGMLLKQAKNSPQAADFWKMHELKTEEDRLVLKFGSVRLELPYGAVTALEETESLLLILKGRDIFELVPKAAFAGEQEVDFREKILEGRDKRKKESLSALRKALLDEASFKAKIDPAPDELAAQIARMKRMSYRFGCGWKGTDVFTLAFPLVLAAYSAFAGAWPTFALCMGAFLLFNLRLILVFFPSYIKRVRDTLLPPGEDGYLLAVREKTAWLLTETQAFSYPMSGLKKKVNGPDGLFLFFERQTMLYVPALYAAAFLRAAEGKKSISENAALGGDTQE